jgi:hypothetical protein
VNVLIFGVGAFVTVLVLGALGLVFYGAILDGRPVEHSAHVAPAVINLDRKGEIA